MFYTIFPESESSDEGCIRCPWLKFIHINIANNLSFSFSFPFIITDFEPDLALEAEAYYNLFIIIIIIIRSSKKHGFFIVVIHCIYSCFFFNLIINLYLFSITSFYAKIHS